MYVKMIIVRKYIKQTKRGTNKMTIAKLKQFGTFKGFCEIEKEFIYEITESQVYKINGKGITRLV